MEGSRPTKAISYPHKMLLLATTATRTDAGISDGWMALRSLKCDLSAWTWDVAVTARTTIYVLAWETYTRVSEQ